MRIVVGGEMRVVCTAAILSASIAHSIDSMVQLVSLEAAAAAASASTAN